LQYWGLNLGPTPSGTPPAPFFKWVCSAIGSHELCAHAGFEP
jgi:hypothetical protein